MNFSENKNLILTVLAEFILVSALFFWIRKKNSKLEETIQIQGQMIKEMEKILLSHDRLIHSFSEHNKNICIPSQTLPPPPPRVYPPPALTRVHPLAQTPLSPPPLTRVSQPPEILEEELDLELMQELKDLKTVRENNINQSTNNNKEESGTEELKKS